LLGLLATHTFHSVDLNLNSGPNGPQMVGEAGLATPLGSFWTSHHSTTTPVRVFMVISLQ